MTYFKSGGWNALCDVCGFKFKSYELRKRWDGLMVCDKDFEHDHPQKYLRVREDKIVVPWVRSRPTDIDVGPVCYLWSNSAYADLGTADCAQADNDTYTYRSLDLLRTGLGGPLERTPAVEGVYSFYGWFTPQRG